LDQIHDELLGNLFGFDIWTVHGDVVRNEIDTDFTNGGNPSRFAYVPENEIWLEGSNGDDNMAILLHELIECGLMAGNEDENYETAHDRATIEEKAFRKQMANQTPDLETVRAWIEKADLIPDDGDLEKMSSPGFKFPKMGFPDDQRQTPIINTSRELEIKQRAFSNAINRLHPEAKSVPKVDVVHGIAGETLSIPNTGISYARGSALRPPESEGRWDPKVHPKAPEATKLHEDLYMMLNRVQGKYGLRARRNVSHNMLEYLRRKNPAGHADLNTFISTRSGTSPSPFREEEHLTTLLNYLNNPKERDLFHEHMRHTPETRIAFDKNLKSAYRTLQEASRRADSSWTDQELDPWVGLEGYSKSEDLQDSDIIEADFPMQSK
jgi:hypothetical protein